MTDPAVPSLANATPVEEPARTASLPDAGLEQRHVANCIAGCLHLLDDGLLGGLPSSNPGSAKDPPLDPCVWHTG